MATKPDIKVRVLVAFDDHQPNHVIRIAAGDIKGLKDGGFVDDDADAVAYAEKNEPQPAKVEA